MGRMSNETGAKGNNLLFPWLMHTRLKIRLISCIEAPLATENNLATPYQQHKAAVGLLRPVSTAIDCPALDPLQLQLMTFGLG